MDEQITAVAAPEVLSKRDVAAYLHVKEDTVHRLFRRTDFPRFYIGSLPRVRKDKLDEYLDSLVGNKRQGLKPPTSGIVLD